MPLSAAGKLGPTRVSTTLAGLADSRFVPPAPKEPTRSMTMWLRARVYTQIWPLPGTRTAT